MKKSTTIMVIVGSIILVLLVWGLIGSSQAEKIGTSCDVGVGEDGSVFCWKWHQNIIGDIGDTINQIFDK